MGLEYNVVCHDCKVQRDLDKIRLADPVTRTEALLAADDLRTGNQVFRATLLLGFMIRHRNHKVTMVPDTDEGYDYPYDYDFWNPTCSPTTEQSEASPTSILSHDTA